MRSAASSFSSSSLVSLVASFLGLAMPLSLTACSGFANQEPPGPHFVAVGAEGTLLQSLDGTSWKSITSGVTSRLTSITFGAGIFVAVGEGGIILASADGVEFSPRYNPTGVDLSHVIHTGERFVAVGGDFDLGAVTVTSKDGFSWENVVSPSGFMFHAVAHRNDALVAAAFARSDLQTPALFAAEPGQPWQETVGPDFRDSVTTDQGMFTLGGSVLNQFVDGLGWSSQTISAGISAHAVTYEANQFIIVGEQGTVFSSPDGKTFNDHSLVGETGYFSGVAFGAETFVAVGDQGRVMTSTDGATWAKQTPPTAKTLFDVAYGGPATP